MREGEEGRDDVDGEPGERAVMRAAPARRAAPRARMHARLRAARVVVADQVQRAVDQQPRDLVVERAAARAGLPRRGLEPDHDVAEQRAAALGVRALEQRERRARRSARGRAAMAPR